MIGDELPQAPVTKNFPDYETMEKLRLYTTAFDTVTQKFVYVECNHMYA